MRKNEMFKRIKVSTGKVTSSAIIRHTYKKPTVGLRITTAPSDLISPQNLATCEKSKRKSGHKYLSFIQGISLEVLSFLRV